MADNLPTKLAADPTVKAFIIECASQNATQEEIADYLGVSRGTLARTLSADSELKTAYETACYEASTQLLERLREIPFSDIDPQRARIQVDAIARYLEMRWPSRFGKRLDVTVQVADMRGALERGRARARGRVIEGTATRLDKKGAGREKTVEKSKT